MSSRNLRQKYLERSANLLTWSSPSTARALHIQRLSLQQRDTVEHMKESQLFCLACGSNSVSLRTAWPEENILSREKRSKPSATGSRKQVRKMVRACQICGKVSKRTFPGPPTHRDTPRPINPVVPLVKDVTPVPAATTTTRETKNTATSSKKRAKARKEGLQALLDKSKQDSKPSLGFTLMDFMRTT